MPETEDLYEILQVHPSAHKDVVDAAYQRLALLYHPATDSSSEAAAKLAALGRAYAVLGDPEKRTVYDRSRETVASRTAAQEQEPPETGPPKAPARRRTKQSNLDYITIGSTKEDVSRIQGPPSSASSTADGYYEGEFWYYDSGEVKSVVSFSKAGRVNQWNSLGDLMVQIVPGLNITTSETFSIGSHKDDVARLQGTPYRIDVPIPKSGTTIRKEREDRKFYREIAQEIGKPIDPRDEGPIGKFDDDDDPDRETWYYKSGVVELSIATGRVTAWYNQDGSLKAQVRWSERKAEWAGQEYFTLGSTQRDVKRVQGEAVKKIHTLEKWSYGNDLLSDEVEFMNGKVIGWRNYQGDLKVRVIPGINATSRPILQVRLSQGRRRKATGNPANDFRNQDSICYRAGGRVRKVVLW